MLDRCLIASRSIEVYLLWTPLDSSSIAISHVLILDSSRQLSIHQETGISINRIRATFLSFLLDLSRSFLTSHLPKHLSLTPNLFPKWSSASRSLFFSGMMLSHSLFMNFLSLDLTFGVFENFWDFFKIVEVFVKVLGWVFV